VLIAAFLAQLLFIDQIKIGPVKPDLLIVLVIFFAIFFGPAVGTEAGFVSGLLKDIYSLDIFGVNIVLLALTGLVTGLLSPKLFRDSKPTQYSLVFASSLVYMTAHYYISSLIMHITYVTLPEYLYGLILPSSLYTSLLSIPVFSVLIGRYRLKETAEYL